MRWSVLLVFLAMWVGGDYHAQSTPAPVWDGVSRFNVLVLGLDNRPTEGVSLQSRTDVVMLASFNPKTGEVGILSIPRDMHFATPETGILQRVNTLMLLGERQAVNNGPLYAMNVIGYNLGMTIDAYIAFDFYAFQRLIDSLGGVTIELTYSISDPEFPDMNYRYDPFYLPRGIHVLNGYDALRFARTRHGDNDYLRGQRQLQVLLGVYTKLKDIPTLQAFLNQTPALVNDLNGHIFSNLSPQDMLSIGLSMLAQEPDSIKTGALNEAFSYFVNQGGGQVRVPDPNKLPSLLYGTFGNLYWE